MEEESTGTSIVPKNAGNKFVKGHSGNPSGRPKGSKNAISLVKLQIEGELRARVKGRMPAVLEEAIRQALPREVPIKHPKTGEVILNEAGLPMTETIDGSAEMIKLLVGMWVPKARASEDEAPREKIVIQIGKLDQVPEVRGVTYQQQEKTN